MITRFTLAALFLTATLQAAPAPVYRAKPAVLPAPGEWVLIWAGTPSTVTLSKDGEYRARWGSQVYRGSWAWDATTRTLHIHETFDGQTWSSWSAQLDDGLAGAAQLGTHRAVVSLRPHKEPKVDTTAIAAAR